MNDKYPRIVENGRKPNRERDGTKNYGKPCVICATGTVGTKWIQINIFRGEDEEIRVCNKHYALSNTTLIEAAYTFAPRITKLEKEITHLKQQNRNSLDKVKRLIARGSEDLHHENETLKETVNFVQLAIGQAEHYGGDISPKYLRQIPGLQKGDYELLDG